MSTRKSEFIKGNNYRVLKAFSKFSETFRAGQELTLIDEGYSRYDGLRIYAFRDVASGQQISLEISDAEDVTEWRAMFEECEA